MSPRASGEIEREEGTVDAELVLQLRQLPEVICSSRWPMVHDGRELFPYWNIHLAPGPGLLWL